MRRAWPVVWLLLACSGGEDERPAAAPDVEGGASSGGTKAGSSSTPEAGADPGSGGAESADAGQGGAGGDGLVYETAGAPPQAPAGACDPLMMPGDEQAQSVGVAGMKLLSMTPDERSVVFSTADGALHVADRSAANQTFTSLEVTLPDGYYADAGAALAADGLSLIVVRDDGSGLGELKRTARGQAFGAEADTTRFALINGLQGTTGRSVGWPVLSSDEQDLYYLSYFGQALVVQSSAGQNGEFAYGTEIDEFTLGGVEGEYKFLSGISSDQRAIFFFDEATGHAMALFRSRPGAPFYDPVDLGEREGVAPNESCSRLYSSIAGDLVFQATE